MGLGRKEKEQEPMTREEYIQEIGACIRDLRDIVNGLSELEHKK